MHSCEVAIVGGGPAGSSAAWRLKQHGFDPIILEAAAFPRTKLCAGWITPDVLTDLQIGAADYPLSFLTFNGIRTHLKGINLRLNTVQHSIRRYEFDDWLLRRSGARVINHQVRSLRQDNGYYVIDDQYRAKYVIGAGGTKCPVYRGLFRDANPRAKALQVVALEQEFPYEWRDGECRLWFFGKGLPGYSWYVPKANGYLNVGVGGMAHKLKQRDDDIKRHWQHLIDTLTRHDLVNGHDFQPMGYSYYLRDKADIKQLDNAFVIGDAAGLATRDLCEGIGAAIRSGLLAAAAIAGKQAYQLEDVRRFSADNRVIHSALEYLFIGRGP